MEWEKVRSFWGSGAKIFSVMKSLTVMALLGQALAGPMAVPAPFPAGKTTSQELKFKQKLETPKNPTHERNLLGETIKLSLTTMPGEKKKLWVSTIS